MADLADKTIPELKEELRKRQLPLGGTKEVPMRRR